MKKCKKISKLFLLGAGIGTCAIAPLVASSCWWFDTQKPGHKNSDPVKPLPGDGGVKKDDTKQNTTTTFSWKSNDGKFERSYKISDEDTITNYDLGDFVKLDDKRNIVGAYLEPILEDKIDELLPDIKKYEVTSLAAGYLPTFAKISTLIRRIDLFSNLFVRKNGENNKVDAVIVNSAVKKLREKIKPLLETLSPINTEKRLTKIWKSHFDDMLNFHKGGAIGEKRVDTFISETGYTTKIDHGYVENSFFNSKYKLGKITQPDLVWKLNRCFIDLFFENREKITSSFQNEMFLSDAFFERTFDHEKYSLANSFIEYFFRHNAVALNMQKNLIIVLDNYLEFLENISKENAVNNEEKTLEEIATESGINESFYKLFDSTLNYLKLDDLLGFTSYDSGQYLLQLFPGTSNYTGHKTDFRSSYVWALELFNRVLIPFSVGINKYEAMHHKLEEFIRKNLNNSLYAEKYDFVYKNIKQIDEVDRPSKISKNEASAKFNILEQFIKKHFVWKYKK